LKIVEIQDLVSKPEVDNPDFIHIDLVADKNDDKKKQPKK